MWQRCTTDKGAMNVQTFFFLNEKEIIKLRTELLSASCPCGRSLSRADSHPSARVIAITDKNEGEKKKNKGEEIQTNTSVTRQETIAFTTPQAWGQTRPATQFHGSDP